MKSWRWILVVAVIAGALLRLPALDLRSMHTDEAVHAIKFGTLLETGYYRYDRNEYHGPTLNYFTLVPALLLSETRLVQVTETTLRIVPVVFGLGLIVLILLIADIGPGAAAMAALFTAFSPAMVFYSRYYIQEMLLVFFGLALIGTAYRFLTGGKSAWAAMAGMSAGLMFATKETWLIAVGAMCLALFLVLLLRRSLRWQEMRKYTRGILLAILSGVLVAVLFYSSFFAHWAGVWDSVLAYQNYFDRASETTRHGHPWHYFLRMLLFWQSDRGPISTEAAIAFFALLGIVRAFREQGNSPGRDLKIFLGVYACLMLFILSAVPYKTPWLVLGILQPFVLLAGCGVPVFLNWFPGRWKNVGVLVVALLTCHLAWQAYGANFRDYDDPGNPYVYSHPTDDVKSIASILNDVMRTDAKGVAVQVVCPGDDYWPLPWYFRALPGTGWWRAIDADFVPTQVILAAPELEPALLKMLYESPPPGQRPLYVPLFERPMFLRPGKEIRGYIRLDIWEQLRKERSG